MKIIKEYSGLVALVAIVLVLLLGSHPVSFGSSANSGNVTNYDAVSVLVGYYVNDVLAINSTGGFVGGGLVTNTPTVSTMATATTTPCAIQSPTTASSTLERATFNVTTSTSTAGLVTIATSTTAFATTSLATSATIAANAQGTVNYHPPVTNAAVIAPGSYVVFSVANVPYGFTYGGTCSATFQTI